MAIITKVRKVRASGQIIQKLEDTILRGSMAAGDRLPSERELQTTHYVWWRSASG